MDDNDQHGVALERDRPWRDAELMEKLYVDELMSATAISEKFDCSSSTVLDWLDRHGIEKRDPADAIKLGYGYHPNEVPLGLRGIGYERWYYTHKDEKAGVFVHQLLAIAEYGFNAVVENEVHHKNGIPWDNRPDNLELVDHGTHMAKHQKLDRDERQEVIEMYRDGLSSYDISDEFDVAAGTIIRIVREHDEDLVRSKGGWSRS